MHFARRSVFAVASLLGGVLLGGVALPSGGGQAVAASPGPSSPAKPSSGSAQQGSCSSTELTSARQRLATQLATSSTRANVLESRVANTKNHLTDADRQALSALVDRIAAGIGSLRVEVEQATSCSELSGLAHQEQSDIHILQSATLQTDLVIASDAESFVEVLIQGVEPKITSAISSAQARGEDVQEVQATYEDALAELSAAEEETNGLSLSLLAQEPSAFPADRSVFLDARTALTNGRNDLHRSAHDLHRVLRQLH